MINALWLVFELAVNLFQSYITMDFARRILRKKRVHDTALFVSAVLGHFTILTIQSFISSEDNWFTLVYLLWAMLYVFYTFDGRIPKKLIAVIIPIVLLTIIPITVLDFSAALLVTSIESILKYRTWQRLIVVLAIQISLLVTFYKIAQLFSKNDDNFSFSDWAITTLIMSVSIIMGALMHNSLINSSENKKDFLIGLSLLFLIILVVLMFSMMISLIKKNREIRESEKLKTQQQYMQYYVDTASDQYETIRKIRHDIKDQITAIEYLLQNSKIDDAQKIISDYKENVYLQEPVVNTDNIMVNAIINSKLTAASAMGITVTCFSVKTFEGIEDHDLCSLLSNSIENAFTACIDDKQSKSKMLSVKISNDDGVYTVLVSNSIPVSVLKENPSLKTTKKDKNTHGLGTKIIREIADKYNGRCDFFEENGVFYCKTVLIT